MRALVTGAAGFIGSHLVDRLLAERHEVRGVDCFTPSYERTLKRANISGALDRSGFELRDEDLRVCDLTPLVRDVDVVFHLSAQPGVRASWNDFALYAEHNVLATQRLLDAVREAGGRRVVYSSSSSVYGNARSYPTDETNCPQPHSPYGVTKLAGEQLCRAYAQNFGVRTLTLRYFTVYGPRQRPDMAMHRLIGACLGGAPFPLYGTGDQVRDFTFVSDVVEANVLAATADVEPGETFNVAGGSSSSMLEIIDLVRDLTGRDVAIDRRPAAPGDVNRTGGSTERIEQQLGWRPQVGLRDGLSAQITQRRAERGSD
jgi:UDP-glucuronate 4-epimerase